MRFRHFDYLRSFVVVARHLNMGRAADELNLSKGAVSYQIRQLEAELGFAVFSRTGRSLTLTDRGYELIQHCSRQFETLERKIADLRRSEHTRITIGMATYFASRWLSPRLMHFITDHPDIGLRIQPLIDLMDLPGNQLDLAVRWGKGLWREPQHEVELIFPCPAWFTCGAEIGRRIERQGIASVIAEVTLLHDRDDSVAWQDWHDVAGLDASDASASLVIPDPNVRVQAVIDGQGVALYDRLVADEVSAGRLYQYRPVSLDDYGYYLVYPRVAEAGSATMAFRDWIMQEAKLG